MDVAELTVRLVAGTSPNLTCVAPVKLVPVIPTDVSPVVKPELGLTPVTVGVEEVLEAIINVAADEEIPAGDWAAVGETAPETLGL